MTQGQIVEETWLLAWQPAIYDINVEDCKLLDGLNFHKRWRQEVSLYV